MKKQVMMLLLAVGVAGGLAALPADAQQAGGGGGGAAAGGGGGGGGGRAGGGRGGRGNFDPAQFRQRMEDQMKTEMGATDDEWKVLQPKIDKVEQLRQASRPAFGGFGGRRNRGGNNGDNAQPAPPPAPAADASAVTKAAYELRVVLLKKDATPDEIKAKLTALRDAKKAAADELAKAQEDLKSVASVRQEAVLVQDGLLD